MGSVRVTSYKIYRMLAKVIVPGLKNSQYHYQTAMDMYVDQNSVWLDLGCGHQILPDWMPQSVREWEARVVRKCQMLVGIDCDFPSLQINHSIGHKVMGNAGILPFQDGAFNLVTSNMVLEHVQDPVLTFAEVGRILRPGGIFLFHTPNRMNYATLISAIIPLGVKKRLIKLLDGREEEDAFHTYYRVNTLRQISSLAESSGFDILRFDYVESNAETAPLGPFALFELLLICVQRISFFNRFKPSIVTVLQKKIDPV